MKITRTTSPLLAILALLAIAPLPAFADRHEDEHRFEERHDEGRHFEGRRDEGRHFEGRHDEGRHWHGEIREFRTHDLARWRGGYWHHGAHEGHLGWWWVVGGVWYFYPQPIYPYPDPYIPPVVTIQQPAPPTQGPYWYYCDSAGAYYPYVPICPSGWRMVPASPASAPPR